jgi:hypothetical protein
VVHESLNEKDAFVDGMQWYLAHKKETPLPSRTTAGKAPAPLGPPKTLGKGLLQGPRGMRFLVSEVAPCYSTAG